MKPERLLIVPMRLPNQHPKLDELERAIYYQTVEAVGNENVTFFDFDEEFGLFSLIPGGVELIKSNQWLVLDYNEMKERFHKILSCVDNVFLYRISCEIIDRGNGSGISSRFTRDVIETELDKCHRSKTYGFQNLGTRKTLPNYLARIIFLESLMESDVGVIHFVLDPREVDLSFMIEKDRYKRMGPLKGTVNPLKNMPYFEWGLDNIYQQDIGKSYWFYYIGTNRKTDVKPRQHILDMCRIVSKDVNDREPDYKHNDTRMNGIASMTDFRFNKTNTQVKFQSQEQYYYHLKLSRYTFVNYPYDEKSFNYQRFMEALVLGCIPFIDEKMNLDDLRLTYSEFYDIIKERKLIYGPSNYSNIASRVGRYEDNGDNEIIEEFRETKAYKALMDINKISKFWERILGWKDVRLTQT